MAVENNDDFNDVTLYAIWHCLPIYRNVNIFQLARLSSLGLQARFDVIELLSMNRDYI